MNVDVRKEVIVIVVGGGVKVEVGDSTEGQHAHMFVGEFEASSFLHVDARLVLP